MSNIYRKLLKPSESERWVNCARSAIYETGTSYLNDDQKRANSEALREAELAHDIMEDFLKKEFIEDYIPTKIYDETTCSAKMIRRVNRFVDFVKKTKKRLQATGESYIKIRRAIDCFGYAQQCVGTPDVFIYNRSRLIVIDFNYGARRLVEAENNAKLMIYALGILDLFDVCTDVKDIELNVYHGQFDICLDWMVTREKLFKWGNDILKPAAESVNRGAEDAERGEWCKYCKGKSVCSVYNNSGIYRSYYKKFSSGNIEKEKQLVERVAKLREILRERNIDMLPEPEKDTENLLETTRKAIYEANQDRTEFSDAGDLSNYVSTYSYNKDFYVMSPQGKYYRLSKIQDIRWLLTEFRQNLKRKYNILTDGKGTYWAILDLSSNFKHLDFEGCLNKVRFCGEKNNYVVLTDQEYNDYKLLVRYLDQVDILRHHSEDFFACLFKLLEEPGHTLSSDGDKN